MGTRILINAKCSVCGSEIKETDEMCCELCVLKILQNNKITEKTLKKLQGELQETLSILQKKRG